MIKDNLAESSVFSSVCGAGSVTLTDGNLQSVSNLQRICDRNPGLPMVAKQYKYVVENYVEFHFF